jgi:hypothetical protein
MGSRRSTWPFRMYDRRLGGKDDAWDLAPETAYYWSGVARKP